jgi:hypothetical protein
MCGCYDVAGGHEKSGPFKDPRNSVDIYSPPRLERHHRGRPAFDPLVRRATRVVPILICQGRGTLGEYRPSHSEEAKRYKRSSRALSISKRRSILRKISDSDISRSISDGRRQYCTPYSLDSGCPRNRELLQFTRRRDHMPVAQLSPRTR